MKKNPIRMIRPAAQAAALMLSLLLGACSLSPDYTRPETELPEKYSQAKGGASSTENAEWWQGFKSSALVRLQALALENNHNFRANRLSLAQTIAQARVARSSLLPGVDAGLSGSRRGSHSDSGGFSLSDSFSGSVQASYELDIWGANREGYNAAGYQAIAGLNAWRGVGLSLESEVALTYFSYLAAKENLAVYESMLGLARQVLDYQTKRERLGASAPLDVSRQRGSVESMEAEYLSYKNKMNEAMNSLCALLGVYEMPSELGARIDRERMRDILPPEVSPGLPAELMARRPDIAEAEARLLAANANIGVARSAFLPGISLTVSGGYQSDSLSSLFNAGSSLFSLAGSLAAPIFNFGKLTAQYESSLAAKEELIVRYQEAALNAFLEVSTALTANTLLREQEAHRIKSADENTEAYRIARVRYATGAEDFLTVLDAQNTVLSSENSLVQTRLERLNSSVSLFKALGGGWAEKGTLDEMRYESGLPTWIP